MTDQSKKGATADRFMSHPGGNGKRKLPKRFYAQVDLNVVDGGYAIELDGKPVKTPSRALLCISSKPLAKAVVAEWEAQETEIDPETMLLTKLANTALDRVAPRRDEIIDEIAGFGASDLMCYRAEHPDSLVVAQREGWDPLLAWLETETGARLEVTEGIVFKAQPEKTLARLRAQVASQSDFELAGLHQVVTFSGSLVLGLAVAAGRLEAEEAHRVAHIDEIWQADQWGWDEEAETRLNLRKEALVAAARYLELLSSATS